MKWCLRRVRSRYAAASPPHARLKSLNETAECWQPAADKVHVVAGAEKALGSVEQARVMLAPSIPLPVPKILQA